MKMISAQIRHFATAVTLSFWATMAANIPALAADPPAQPGLTIELNNLEQRSNACRLTLLIDNKLGTKISDLGFELVLFGKDQRIIQLLAVEAGSFPKTKSRVKQFDLTSVACVDISRILLNSITRCAANDFTPDTCLAATRTTTRTSVPLAY
jgi:hypothetical protein